MSDQFDLDQITEIELIIAEINAGIRLIVTGGHSSYALNTGQSEQSVKRLSLDELRAMRKELLLERDNLRAACGLDRSVITGYPGF